MKNTFGWMQLASKDPKGIQNFYSQLFDWSFTHKETGQHSSYTEIDAGEGPCGGIAKGENEGESHWIPFVNVKDIHAITQKAESLGAKIVVPITDLGGEEGFYSVFVDPNGAVLGIYQPR